jgi:hypothetical protein
MELRGAVEQGKPIVRRRLKNNCFVWTGGRLGIQLRGDLKYKFFCAEEAQLSALLSIESNLNRSSLEPSSY